MAERSDKSSGRSRSSSAADPPKGYSLGARIWAQLAHPAIRCALVAQSEYRRLRSATARPIHHSEAPYSGQKILLIALFQKGAIRPDLKRLLRAAKSAGLYVLAVNTLRLKDPASLDGLVDCYIERVNYGRDFGSYKLGFLHIFARSWDRTCPRLMMLNDSVFYAGQPLEKFIADMMESDIEVLGSTENFEINYHLGSFCIALGGAVLRHPRFRRYWRRYLLSDVRPVVIKRGEMGLSRVLGKCVSSPDQMRALFDSSGFAEMLKDADEAQIDEFIALVRRGDLTPARRFVLKQRLDEIEADYLIRNHDATDLRVSEATIDEIRRDTSYIGSLADLKSALSDRLMGQQNQDLGWARRTVVAKLLDNFRQHSQIHQNAAILLALGLPLVKLDLVYRGMFDMSDVETITRLLPDGEAQELNHLLLSRPFGGDVLFGWKRAAFMNGLI